MARSDLSVIVSELQRMGFDARNLGQEGIVVWVGSDGQYFPADRREELLRRFLSPAAGESAAREDSFAR